VKKQIVTTIEGISLPLVLDKSSSGSIRFVENFKDNMIVGLTFGEGYCEISTWFESNGVYKRSGTTIGVSTTPLHSK